MTLTKARNDVLTVGVTAVQVSPPRPERSRFALKNTSAGAQVITIVFGTGDAPVANSGVVLEPGEMVTDSDSGLGYFCFKGEISAIANLAAGQLSIFEA